MQRVGDSDGITRSDSDRVGSSDSDRITLADSVVWGNSQYGVRVESGNDSFAILGGAVRNNAYSGAYLRGSGGLVDGAEVHGNGQWGLDVSAPSGAPTIMVTRSKDHDNDSGGITASSNALITGNEVYSHLGSGDRGIYASYGATVENNLVHHNYDGIGVAYNQSYGGTYGATVGQELVARHTEVEITAVIWMNGGVYPDLHRPTVGQQLLLDHDHGGHFQLQPVLNDANHRQLYLPDTNVLLTRFLSDEGVAEISCRPAGRVSTTTTFVAVDGPAFVTVIV